VIPECATAALSKEEFLRQLRGGKSKQLAPKNNPPLAEQKSDK